MIFTNKVPEFHSQCKTRAVKIMNSLKWVKQCVKEMMFQKEGATVLQSLLLCSLAAPVSLSINSSVRWVLPACENTPFCRIKGCGGTGRPPPPPPQHQTFSNGKTNQGKLCIILRSGVSV